MTDDVERPLAYVPIRGPGVDRLERRKERGSLKEITERELRASVERSIGRITKAIKQLVTAFNSRTDP